MGKKMAVMDLGTNTFHLLIAEQTPEGLIEIVHREDAVKLGEGGINKGLIQAPAYARGLKAMEQFAELIADHGVQETRAIATSALRNAANGADFIAEVKAKTNIKIEIINGDAEAGCIYKGIKASGCLTDQNSLIMDIGGGSVEFIICNATELLWKQSFEIGAARLMDKFHGTDPIPVQSVSALNIYLADCLTNLFTAAKRFTIVNLIGSSGVFESYAEVIELPREEKFDIKKTKLYTFVYEELIGLIAKITRSSHQERLQQKGILPIRIDMIVTASILTLFVIEKLGIIQVAMSTNSLKEGVLAEMMD